MQYIQKNIIREVTLFRVNAEEICVLLASCLMDTITFDVLIEATEETEVLVLPASTLNRVMQQILFLKIDQRVAQFL